MPRHSKIYTDLIPIIEDVYLRYMDDVRSRAYPGPEHTAYMADVGLKKLMKVLNWKPKMNKSKAEQEAAKRVSQGPVLKKPTAKKSRRSSTRKKN